MIGILITSESSLYNSKNLQQSYFTYLAIKNSGNDAIFLSYTGNINVFENFNRIPIRNINHMNNLSDIKTIILSTVIDVTTILYFKNLNIRIIYQIGENI